jgi:DNA-directed RNA polymerase subunit beta
MISIGTGLIPFLEHNDANRALMGSNMQRQAIPLIYKENPLVETGIEKLIPQECGSTKMSKSSGLAKYVSQNKIIIQEKIVENIKAIELNKQPLLNKIKKQIKEKYYPKQYKQKIYTLEKIKKTNQDTYALQEPVIKKGKWVKRAETLVDSPGTKNGKLALGKNLLVGYMAWEGYNFEDAIVINKRLVENDILTSIHIKKYKSFLINNEIGEVRITETNI